MKRNETGIAIRVAVATLMFLAGYVSAGNDLRPESQDSLTRSAVQQVENRAATHEPRKVQHAREQRILRLLQGYEWQLDVDAFRLLPEDCWQDLLRISTDKRYMKVVRSRAAIALTLYANDDVWLRMKERLKGLASGAAENVPDLGGHNRVTRRRVVEQMCQAFAASRPGAVEELMIPLLGASDPHLRVKAARCLQTVMDETGERALKTYRDKLQSRSGEQNWELESLGLKPERTEQ